MPHAFTPTFNLRRPALALALGVAAAVAGLTAGPARAQEAVPATATVTAGGLNFINSTPAAVAFPPVALNGVDQTAAQTQAFNVSDATGSGAGWKVTATSTTFSSGGTDTLPVTATTIAGAPSAACDASSTCALPDNGVWTTYTLPADTVAPTASIMYRAQAGSGMGNQTVTPNWSLAIPASAAPGSYSSTWTFTLTSGPS